MFSDNKKAFIIILILAIVIIVINYILILRPKMGSNSVITIDERVINDINDRFHGKTFEILLWTKWFALNDWQHFELNNKKCRFSNCILTSNRNRLNKSDAIVYHWCDLDPNNIPKYKLPHHKWVLHYMEPPIGTPLDKLLKINDLFDWIMGYRKDADIYAPYGRINKCFNNDWKQRYSFENKTKDIAWMVSNCKTDSEREKYVKKLQQYIDVDIYGRCGDTYSCRRFTAQCDHFIQQTYKFYLSFENSICDDYVTEKLFFYMGFDIIPVVLGSVDYKSLLPYNSYIDVFNFSSPQHLSQYLKEVGSDRNKYNSYFDWKKYFCSEETDKLFFCDLCEKLNKEYVKSSKPKKRNLYNFWVKDANCKKISHFYNLN